MTILHRRQFLNSALGAASAALMGCTIPKDAIHRDAAACGIPHDDILRIDVHCHLINHDDVNGSAFITRRLIPLNGLPDLMAGALARSVISGLSLGTSTIEVERDRLQKFFGSGDKNGMRLDYSPEKFCDFAIGKQKGFFLSGDLASRRTPGTDRLTGFASDRMRNAAAMMAYWPEVDIFMPSMVDLYEVSGGAKDDKHPYAQVGFYKDLNLATRGRFLPMVSYNPERQVRQSRREGMKALDVVERAIEEMGFIGVKVHPSAGFNPIENQVYGCPNNAIQLTERLSSRDGIAYDRAMEALYRLCERLDVPILTHGSDSLASHEACMHGTTDRAEEIHNQRRSPDPLKQIAYRDPEMWTNSTLHWANMLKKYDDQRRLRVCIAHYGSRFQNHLAAKRSFAEQVEADRRYNPVEAEKVLQPYGARENKDQEPNVEYQPREHKDDQDCLIPSAWLQRAMDEIDSGNDRLWLDMSFMPELCYSAASDPDSPVNSPVPRLFSSASKVSDAGRYARAFTRHLEENKALHGQVMYGTDWHMPEISILGPSYRELIESVLPESCRRQVMGQNAAEFFGLACTPNGSKPMTRQRLEVFYEKAGIELAEVKWIDRLKTKMNG